MDNDANYSCGHCDECMENGWTANCRWATDVEQANNKRNNVRFTYKGETKTLAEWSRETKINYATLLFRINRMNLTICEAIERPILANKPTRPSESAGTA